MGVLKVQYKLPLAGFSVIEAESLNEVIELVSNTRSLEQEA
jgi:hypothetical protein